MDTLDTNQEDLDTQPCEEELGKLQITSKEPENVSHEPSFDFIEYKKKVEQLSTTYRKIPDDFDNKFKENLKDKVFKYSDILSHNDYCFTPTDLGAGTQKKLHNEFISFEKMLPCEFSSSFYIRADETNPSCIKALIAGGRGTPYEHGLFEFDILIEPEYPQKPPKVKLKTTGKGSIRFNPNLYKDGYVCLSLLGTWEGEPEEAWNPGTSNLAQVLLSISYLVMNENVVENEPQYECWTENDYGYYQNEGFCEIIRLGNILYSMIDMIKNPSPIWKDVIASYFKLKSEQLLEDLNIWIKRKEHVKVQYDDICNWQNPEWAGRLLNDPQEYLKSLQRNIEELKTLLSNL